MVSHNSNTPLKERDAAEYIGMSTAWLRLSRMRGTTKAQDAPPFLKIGKSVRYLRSDLDEWLASRRKSPGRAA